MRRWHHLTHRVACAPVLLRVMAFVGGLAVIWLPLAGGIVWAIALPNLQAIVLMAWLFLAFLLMTHLWGRWVYRGDRLLQRYGLTCTRQMGRDLLLGGAIALLSLFGLMGIQSLLGWLVWQLPPDGESAFRLGQIALEGGLVAIAVGLAEELVFRGWLLDELERDVNQAIALWMSSIIFAVLHFIKPLAEIWRTFPQFPGLVLLGLMLVWAKRSRRGQLGLAIGLHGGLVWGYYLIQVGELVRYLERTPELWSGIDQNPLAGGLGLILLTGLALGIRWMAMRPSEREQEV